MLVLGSAVRSLKRAPVRSGLTALGVIVGVGAVVATASIGNGARVEIQKVLTKPESRTIYLNAVLPPSERRRLGTKSPPSEGLQTGDYEAIWKLVTGISAASPRIYIAGASARTSILAKEVLLEGIGADGFTILSRRLLSGAAFSRLDVSRASNVCVISESLARELGGDRAIHRPIRINDAQFTVVGIVDDVPNTNPLFSSADFHVYVPFTSLQRRIDASASMAISVQSADIEHVGDVQQQISDTMEQRRSGRKTLFVVRNALDSIKTYAEGSLIVARLLAVVGAISLVVGGIGIMNILLVSVTERTREIGVRLAIGTRHRAILGQFMAEAVLLSVLGGAIGIACGWAASLLITKWNDWPTATSGGSILAAVCCSVLVGVSSGYYPARRAALLSPVESLRVDV